MKRQVLSILTLAAIITTILLTGCSGEPEQALSGLKVLVYVRDKSSYTEFMLTHEIGVMLSMLEEAGIQAVVATQSEDSYRDSDTPLKSDILLQDVNVADYDGFLLPCMAAGKGENTADAAVAMVKEAAAQNKPIAAMHGTVPTLAKAGLLDGKHYAYDRDSFPEGIYDGLGVVRDGNIITGATCSQAADYYDRPDDTVELTQTLIDAITP